MRFFRKRRTDVERPSPKTDGQMPATTLTAPSAAALAFLAQPHTSFIDGKFIAGGSGASIPVENPARQTIVAQVQAATLQDIDLAVAAARRSFETGWGIMAPKDRARVLLRFADLLEAHADEIGEIETIDFGIPITLSTHTIRGFCTELFRYYAGWATKLEGATIPAVANGREDQDLLVYTMREPVGVVAAIVPWNAPVSMFALKMAPALAAGCTLVMKTAELAPLSPEFLGALWNEAGGPPGSFNILHGTGNNTGAALVRHMGVDKVSFTGSTAVGKDIVRAVSNDLRRVTLELGGKSPFVVFDDAPLEEAIPAAALACFFLAGQNCMAGTRLFVHEFIHDRIHRRYGQSRRHDDNRRQLVSSHRDRSVDFRCTSQQGGKIHRIRKRWGRPHPLSGPHS